MFDLLPFRYSGKASFRTVLLVLALTLSTSGRSVSAGMNFCPFCAAINATFGEQINKHEITVIAKLVEIPPEDPDAVEFPKAKFEIVKVIKGADHVGPGMLFLTQLVGSYDLGEQFLVMGVEPPEVMWSTPMKANNRVVKYLLESTALPQRGPERLAFFQNYFEDEESILAFDAYDEFAIADFEDLLAMKDRMKREQLVEWVNDPDLRIDRRRLYFTMLSVCGGKSEIEMLEGLIRSGEKEKIRGLDALVSCYLMLKGEDGLKLIEETFLKNPDTDYVDCSGVLSALRFHGTEVSVIAPKRIAESARLVLNQVKLADQVIPDLARWEDWSVMNRLVTMFKESNHENEFIRLPVVTYLNACPLPEAKVHLEELSKIDPDVIRRAKFYGGFDDDESDDEEKGESKPEPSESEKTDKSGEPNSENDDGANESTGLESFQTISSEILASSALSEQFKVSTGFSESLSQEDPELESHVVLKHPLTSGLESEAVFSSPEPEKAPSIDMASVPTASTANEKLEETFVSSSGANGPTASGAANATNESENKAATVVPPVAIVSPNITLWIVFVSIGFSTVIFIAIWSVVNGWFERLIL